MTTHKVIHGRLTKGQAFTDQDSLHLMHEMTPGQRSFFRECALQQLGRPPSKFWGHQPVPLSFPQIDKPTAIHIVRSLNHPHHVTSDLLLSNDKAAAGFSSMAKSVARGAEKVGEYAGKAASFVGKHMDTIKKIGQAINTGIGVAQATGIIPNDSALSEANDLLGSLLGDDDVPAAGFYKNTGHKKQVRSF